MFLDEKELNNTISQETPQNSSQENEPYQLSTASTVTDELEGELAGLVGDMNQESAKISDTDYNVEIPESEIETEKPKPNSLELRAAQTTSEAMLAIFDDMVSRGFAMYALDNKETFKADEQELKEVAKHFAPYLGKSNFEIPSWAFGVYGLVFMLADKFKAAKAIREANMEAQEYKEKLSKLEKEHELLKKEVAVSDLEKKVGKLRVVKKTETKD